MVFGIVLGVVSIVLMAWFVNLVAAFLTLLAIGFYVFVYTIMLKRTTPQNIVIGGAAGALPPVIGWAAVTGRVEIPALLLFAMVFYWTPPHFWALVPPDPQGLRGGQRADAAGGPRRARDGAPDRACTRSCSSRSAWCSTPSRGWVRSTSSPRSCWGPIFLWRAFVLWRQATSPEGSLAQAIRLYKYSISYLTLLFAAVGVDSLLFGTLS